MAQEPKAQVNLVVAQAGLGLAEFMEKEYGIPYVVSNPVGSWDGRRLSAVMMQAIEVRKSIVLQVMNQTGDVLIVGEQVMANSIRYFLNKRYGVKDIRVACYLARMHAWPKTMIWT